MINFISRRQFSLGLSSLAMADLSSSHGRAYIPIPDGRVAILDTSENAAKVVEKLKDKNIKVIARYYAREPQPPLPEKRVAFNKIGDSLESKILTDNGIASCPSINIKINSRKSS